MTKVWKPQLTGELTFQPNFDNASHWREHLSNLVWNTDTGYSHVILRFNQISKYS